MPMQEIKVRSTLDGSVEPSLLAPGNPNAPSPLVVCLHTWSEDRFNQVQPMLELTRPRRWALLLPEFRGPNLKCNPRRTEACASRLAMQDVIDAVEHVRQQHRIDMTKLFLLGGSGGGHMALMLAAHFPRYWSAVSSWCPITHLATWHGQNPRYAPHIAACCGDAPGRSPTVDRQYADRSPLSHVAGLAKARLYLHHGRADHSVPWSHSWRLAEALIRHRASRFYFDLFDGGHELRHELAMRQFDMITDQAQPAEALTG